MLIRQIQPCELTKKFPRLHVIGMGCFLDGRKRSEVNAFAFKLNTGAPFLAVTSTIDTFISNRISCSMRRVRIVLTGSNKPEIGGSPVIHRVAIDMVNKGTLGSIKNKTMEVCRHNSASRSFLRDHVVGATFAPTTIPVPRNDAVNIFGINEHNVTVAKIKFNWSIIGEHLGGLLTGFWGAMRPAARTARALYVV